jgi:transposase
MKKINKQKGEELFAGIDLHKRRWHVTIRTADVEIFSNSIAGKWEDLRRVINRYKDCRIHAVYEAGCFGFSLYDHLTINRYKDCRIHAVYEAGCFGFSLYDHLTKYGVDCIVTPPSLIPQEHGNRVKTDRLDSRKLARLLAKGLLKSIWVPSAKERFHRQVIRELCFYGIDLPTPRSKWSQVYFTNLQRIKFKNHWMQKSFNQLLEQYEFLCAQIDKQTQLLKQLAQLPLYRDRVKILRSIPGIGILTAMEILLELQDFSRFRRAEQLAAYVGLTPSQYSSADKIRMGRITGAGKNTVRSALVESCWQLIRKDKVMREKYEQIKARAGGKRAIVAVSRKLILCIRRLLLDNRPYVYESVS